LIQADSASYAYAISTLFSRHAAYYFFMFFAAIRLFALYEALILMPDFRRHTPPPYCGRSPAYEPMPFRHEAPPAFAIMMMPSRLLFDKTAG